MGGLRPALGDEDRLAALRRKITPFILRRLKTQVATELPPKTHIVHSVDITGQQRDLYEGIRMAAHATVRKVVDKKGFAASTVDILGALLKLRQQILMDPPCEEAAVVGRRRKVFERQDGQAVALDRREHRRRRDGRRRWLRGGRRWRWQRLRLDRRG